MGNAVHSNTATALTVLNTTGDTQLLPVHGFGDGVETFTQTVTILGHHKLRLVSDVLPSSSPLSWDPDHSTITNFTDFVGFARIDLPDGVLIGGASLFNPGTSVVDSRAYQGEIPLRFSELPAACQQHLVFEPEDTDGTGTVVTLYNGGTTIEEPELVRRLGNDYVGYSLRTPMFVPGIKSRPSTPREG